MHIVTLFACLSPPLGAPTILTFSTCAPPPPNTHTHASYLSNIEMKFIYLFILIFWGWLEIPGAFYPLSL